MDLKILRKKRAITIQQVANKLDIDAGNLSKIEQGKLKPSVTVLMKLSKFFNVSVDSLLGKPHLDFISFFRSAAPYINTYRNKTFVIAVDGFAIDSNGFSSISTDINLLHALGIKIVIVHGLRPFIDHRLNKLKMQSKFHKQQRITTAEMMPHVIETNGFVKTKIEAALSSNIYLNNISKSELKISSGNFIMAKPSGVIGGVDMENTGVIREINREAVNEKLNNNEIVIISPIGYSPIGEIFNLPYESTAGSISHAIKAEKLIFYSEDNGFRNIRGEHLSEITIQKAINLYSHINESEKPEYIERNSLPILKSSINALKNGLQKVHVINRHVDGSIITELFTNQGQGTVITHERIEKFRLAKTEDAKIIEKLIKPLADNQVLVNRSLENIENEIDSFFILEFDKKIIGCAKINHYKNMSEIGCFAINENYQDMGYGKKLLTYCEAKCHEENRRPFVMTTQSAHWFLENGYKLSEIEALPDEKKALYSTQRNSKVLIKELETE